MPGKIKSTAEQAYLAIHRPAVLHELSGGHIPKGLPHYAPKKGRLQTMHEKMKGK